jgi:hypothetical protein
MSRCSYYYGHESEDVVQRKEGLGDKRTDQGKRAETRRPVSVTTEGDGSDVPVDSGSTVLRQEDPGQEKGKTQEHVECPPGRAGGRALYAREMPTGGARVLYSNGDIGGNEWTRLGCK